MLRFPSAAQGCSKLLYHGHRTLMSYVISEVADPRYVMVARWRRRPRVTIQVRIAAVMRPGDLGGYAHESADLYKQRQHQYVHGATQSRRLMANTDLLGFCERGHLQCSVLTKWIFDTATSEQCTDRTRRVGSIGDPPHLWRNYEAS